jgi:hypothetical protein
MRIKKIVGIVGYIHYTWDCGVHRNDALMTGTIPCDCLLLLMLLTRLEPLFPLRRDR